jgi:uncharacterized membrane protein YjgN (DUF898 family)
LEDTYQAIGQPALQEQRYPVEFTGLAGEYFRIWVVNLALTILTLGIYSAWAKVRKKRYFYGNTLIAGEPFEYRGNPVSILKGRAIAAVLLALNYALSRFYPALYIPFLILLAIAVPWLVCRSLAFNAHNSAYRNITFGFTGRYVEALKIIIGIALLIPFTLGFIYPYYKMRQLRFIADHHRYGATPFSLQSRAGSFYRTYFAAFGLLLGLLLVFGIVVGAIVALGTGAGVPGPQSGGPAPAMLTVSISLPIYAIYLFVFVYTHVRVTNLVWNNLKAGPVSFVSALQARKLFALYLTNVLAILFTAGLATPWAAIRATRYRRSVTTVLATEPLDNFAAETGRDVSATGEAVSEMFDIDIGL